MKKANKKGRARRRKTKSVSPKKQTRAPAEKASGKSKAAQVPEKKEVPRRLPEKKVPSEPKGPAALFKKGIQFLREAKNELKKVKWPTRKELLASTAVVILLVLVVALYLGLVDFGLIKIIKNLLG